MKARLLPVLMPMLVLGLCSCGKPEQSDAENEGPGTFWELRDDSQFTVVTDPRPPRTGPGQLKVDVSADDSSQKFSGTVEYRLAPTEQNTVPWQPMPKVREDGEGAMHFQAPITLTGGRVFIQFRVRDTGDRDFTELTDWAVEVK